MADLLTTAGRIIDTKRSQNKLLNPVDVTDTGLSIDKDFIRIKIKNTDVRNHKIVILPAFDGGAVGADAMLKLKDGNLYTKDTTGGYAGMGVECTSLSQIPLDLFMALVDRGALRITEGIVRCSDESGDSEAKLQAIQSFGLIGVDIKGFDEDPLNVSIIKGQELQDKTVLGPFRFPTDTVLCMSQGITYQLNGVNDETKPVTTVIDIYFDGYINMGSLLKNGFSRERLKRK